MAVQYKDYYQVLGVAKGVPQEEIRKAFRRLARLHHPDVAKDKKAAESKFKEINEAYEVLGDPEKRRQYDELGANWAKGGAQGPRGWGGGGNGGNGGNGGFGSDMDPEAFSDFFETFFGGARNPMAGQKRRTAARAGAGGQARHLEAEVHVSVEDLLKGARKRVSFRRPGQSSMERVDVVVPAGFAPQNKIRLAGKGERGGDLLLRVVITPNPDYHVEASDLIHELKLPAWKAVLGAEVQVTTADGAVRLKIPPGTQPGRRFRLAGRGLPLGGGRRGDFFVQVQVVIPESFTAEERACWERLGELHGIQK